MRALNRPPIPVSATEKQLESPLAGLLILLLASAAMGMGWVIASLMTLSRAPWFALLAAVVLAKLPRLLGVRVPWPVVTTFLAVLLACALGNYTMSASRIAMSMGLAYDHVLWNMGTEMAAAMSWLALDLTQLAFYFAAALLGAALARPARRT